MNRSAVRSASPTRRGIAGRSAAVALAAALIVSGGLVSSSAALAAEAPAPTPGATAAPPPEAPPTPAGTPAAAPATPVAAPTDTPVAVAADTSVAPAPAALAPPTVAGTPRVGLTLTATVGSWGDGEQPYATTSSWSVGGTPVARSVNSKTLLLATADVGKTVTFTVVGLFQNDVRVERTSAPTGAVTAGVSVVKPGATSVTGSGLVGQPLTALASGWMPEPISFVYQWSVGGKPVAGATASTYTPVAADAGKRVTVAITGSYPGAAPATRIATLAGSVVQVGRIMGTVTRPGTPVRPVTNGTAMLYRSYAIAGDSAQPVAYATIANGRYSFSGVTPGDYTIEFLDRDTEQEAFLGGGISISASTPLTVPSGGQVTKNFIFTETGSISGVLKLTGPAAAPDDVFVITATSVKGSAETFARADGSFTVPGLPGGSYTLVVTTFNNRDQTSPDYRLQVYTVGLGATPGSVAVAAGRETTGVTIVVKPAPVVTGRITAADTGMPVPFGLIMAYRVVGGQPDRFVEEGQTELDGTFRMPALEPGLYKFVAHPPAGEGLGDAYFGGTSLSTAKVYNLRNGDVVAGLTAKVPTVAP